MRNTSRFHPFSCCCRSCLDNETRDCERCEGGAAVDGEDYCQPCLDAMSGKVDEDESDAAESDVHGA